MIFSRSIVLQDGKKKNMVNEVKNSAKSFVKESGKPAIDEILLTGDLGSAEKVQEKLLKSIAGSVSYTKLSSSNIPTVLIAALEHAGHCITNFIPQDLVRYKSQQDIRRKLIRLASSCAVMALFLFGSFYTRYFDKADYREKLNREIIKTERRAERIKLWMTREKMINEQFNSATDPLTIIRELYLHIHKSTVLKAFDYDE